MIFFGGARCFRHGTLFDIKSSKPLGGSKRGTGVLGILWRVSKYPKPQDLGLDVLGDISPSFQSFHLKPRLAWFWISQGALSTWLASWCLDGGDAKVANSELPHLPGEGLTGLAAENFGAFFGFAGSCWEGMISMDIIPDVISMVIILDPTVPFYHPWCYITHFW